MGSRPSWRRCLLGALPILWILFNQGSHLIFRILQVTGVPVVKSSSDWTLLGVLSKKDVQIKSGSTVSEIMSKPPIAARPDNKVADAACLMLKHKVNSNFIPFSPSEDHRWLQWSSGHNRLLAPKIIPSSSHWIDAVKALRHWLIAIQKSAEVSILSSNSHHQW